MINKKIIILLLVVIVAVNSAGCTGTWRRKFVRKKHEEVKEGPVLVPADYSKEFSNSQLYINHFAFWKNNESELLVCIQEKKSEKRLRTYAGYSISELKEMYNLLVEEKRQELSPFIDELKDIVDKVNDSSYLNAHRNLLADRLRKHHRIVSRKFSYWSCKQHIKENESIK